MSDPLPDLSECTTMHADVCPDCRAVTTHHGLDPAPHCPHGFERRVPVEFVIRDDYDRLSAENERLRKALEGVAACGDQSVAVAIACAALGFDEQEVSGG